MHISRWRWRDFRADDGPDKLSAHVSARSFCFARRLFAATCKLAIIAMVAAGIEEQQPSPDSSQNEEPFDSEDHGVCRIGHCTSSYLLLFNETPIILEIPALAAANAHLIRIWVRAAQN